MYTVDKEKIYWRKVEGETVILNIETGFYYALDEVGSGIWDDLVCGRDAEKTHERLTREYEGDPAQIQKDTNEILRKLLKEKLISQ